MLLKSGCQNYYTCNLETFKTIRAFPQYNMSALLFISASEAK